MKNLAFATITQLQELIQKKEISPEQILEFFIQRFQKYDGELGSALEIFDKDSIIQAVEKKQGLLQGIPGLIKDNICQKGRITSCASKILQNFKATYDATAISRLKAAGAPLLGRANMDEFAMGSSTETSAYKKTKNPWNKERVPGGSSGGSIAAVAAGLVPWALGSETGGSVRQPAALCGIVGLKPTYGLISRYGLVAYASSLDQIGIATRTVYDNALILSIMAGNDVRDSSSLSLKQEDYTKQLTGKIKPGLKIGVIDNALHAEGIDPQVYKSIEQALDVLKKLGASIEYVSLTK
jgi:aspartyl-tRNA(Asn)/glutamyl-tRNA(Gln) amidotransferase subunit A